MLTNSPELDPRSAEDLSGAIPLQSFLSAPALIEDELVGQINVANASRDYTAGDLDLLERLADLYALAIQRNRMDGELRSLALFDPLTGLYNRRGFITLAEQQMRIANRTKRNMLLVFTDLDGMKWINDHLGHHVGDQALIAAANVFREVFRESDIIARYGGDEFVVLVLEILEFKLEVIRNRLHVVLAAENAAKQRPYHLSLSMGMVVYDPDKPCSLEELLRRADQAMYEDKRGKNRSGMPAAPGHTQPQTLPGDHLIE